MQCRGRKEVDYRAGITNTAIGRGEIPAATLRGRGNDGQRAIRTRGNVDTIGLQRSGERQLGYFHLPYQEGGYLQSGIEDCDARTIGLNQNQIVTIEFDLVYGDTLGEPNDVVRARCYRFGNLKNNRCGPGLTSGGVDRDRLSGAIILCDQKCGPIDLTG